LKSEEGAIYRGGGKRGFLIQISYLWRFSIVFLREIGLLLAQDCLVFNVRFSEDILAQSLYQFNRPSAVRIRRACPADEKN
jgi:hypothetical protein